MLLGAGEEMQGSKRLYINNVLIDFERNVALGPDGESRIEPKLAHLLFALASDHGTVLSRDALIERVWDNAHGADQSLTNSISQLRRVLGDTADASSAIETVPKRGYRLLASVVAADNEHQSAGPSAERSQAPNTILPEALLKSLPLVGLGLLLTIIFGAILFADRSNVEETAEAAIDVKHVASIAVLPFVNIAEDENQTYFSDGISEEILNALVRVEDLSVASRTSAFTFKNSDKLRVPEIASILGVRYVLEGSVRRSGDTIRVTAQLIDAGADQHLWSDTFDKMLTTENIFAIQHEIAEMIVVKLRQEIPGIKVGQNIQIEPDTESLLAYDLYLQARELFLARNTENLRKSIELYEQSVEADPDFARAWSGLSAAYQIAPTWVLLDQDYAALGQAAALQSLELDPQQALPHAVLALGATESNPADYVQSFEHFDRALEQDPNNSTVLLWRGISYTAVGFFETANRDFMACLQVDPAYEICRRWLALSYLLSGNTGQAFELFEHGAAKGVRAHVGIFAKAYAAAGDSRSAIITWAWDLGSIEVNRQRLYRAHTERDFDFDREGRSFEVEYYAETGRQIPWGKIGGIDAAHTFKRYESLEPFRFYPVWWLRMHDDFLTSPERKRLIREHGILDYWQEVGFPPQCRPVSSDDFECD